MWRSFRGIVFLLTVFLVSAFVVSCKQESSKSSAGTGTSGNVAAVVNGEAITMKELIDKTLKLYGDSVLEDLIMRKLVLQEAKKEGITVSDEEIERELKRLEKQVGGQESLSRRLKGSNVSKQDLRDEIRFNLILKKLVLKKMVSDSDLKIFYDTQLKPNAPFAEIWVIVVTDRDTAISIMNRLKEGVPFEQLAKEYSMAATSRLGGTLPNGYIGIVSKKQIESGALVKQFVAPQLAEPIFKAKPGDVIGPIEVKLKKGQKFYYIIKVERILKSFDDLKEIAENELAKQKVNQFLANLRSKAQVEKKWSPDLMKK